MIENHVCEGLDTDAFKIYHEKGLVNNWVLEDVENEDHNLYIWFCPYCGVRLDK